VIDDCDADYGDCDADERNGCEAHLPSNAAHCGTCDHGCAFPNADAVCVDGACAIGDCNLNFNDCNGDPADGCESNSMEDVENCGQCGNACLAVFPNAEVICAGGTCEMGACLTGFEDCNDDPADGCEVDVLNDPANCDGCGQACTLDNAAAGCQAGGCVVEACDVGWGDCDGQGLNGCETNLNSDPNHCGGCGLPCDLANATAECVSGACRLDQCDNGFSDCNGDLADGCEINKLSDPANCGHCGVACPQGQTCEMGVCEEPDDGGGCGCSTSSGTPLAGLLLLGLLGLIGRRRLR
jgi:MYXO-CTERM domain-containing protein